jgi:RNA polymerase-binding transcription factor DksA
MDQQTLDSFAGELQHRRADILTRVAHTQEDLADLAAEEESEWSDSALEEDTKHVLARLDVRETAAIREIDRDLERI